MPLILLFASAHLQAQIQFEQVLPPPPAPQIIADFEVVQEGSVAFADVDGDGDQDVLITGEKGVGGGIARLYANNGSGSYTLMTGTSFEGVRYSSVAFADIDGDGDQDVLITGLNGSYQPIARLYTNDGSGVYTLVSGTPFQGVEFGSIAFADVDGDGDQDVLITGKNGSSLGIARLYTNNGTGSYTLVSGTPFQGVQYSSIAFADVDGDGDQDVLITGRNNSSQRIAKLYTNDGNGGYTLVSGTPFEGVYKGSVAFADVDGDGDQDVLITGLISSSLRIAWLYTNDGSGGYTLVSGTPFQGVEVSSIAFADVDGDGDQDVLITGLNGSLQRIARLYTNDGSGSYTLVSVTPFEGVELGSIAFADVDWDGDQDVLITGLNSSGQRIAQLYTNNGSGGYTLVSGTPFEGVERGSIAFADVDGDGDQDVLITGRNSSSAPIARLYTNNGSGGYSLVSSTPSEGVQNSSIAFADVDGDGDQDVLITGSGPAGRIARLYTNNGSGGYTLLSGTPFQGVEFGSIAFADVDGDGDQDVLITGSNLFDQKIARLYTNNGSGSYTLMNGTPFEGVSSSSIAFADVDGDGDQDVLIIGLNSSVQRIARLYTNNGSGGYALVSGTPFQGVSDSSIAFADVDGDGDQDVLITGRINSSQRIAQLYTNNGGGGYTLVSGTPFEGVSGSSIAFADVDGDGDQDVLITGGNGSIEIAKLYSNDGSGGYTLVSGTPFEGASSSSVAFSDVDGDGDQDVLITGSGALGPPIAKLYRNLSAPACPINATCAPFTLTLSPAGIATLLPDNIDNGSTTTCGTPIRTLSQTEFDASHLGENLVTLTVTDENGNSDTCETTVTVQPPAEGFPLVNVVSVPSEIEVIEGDSFALTIRIEPDSVGQVTSADVALSFNPALLQVTSVSLALGTLLNTPSQPAVFDNTAGTLFAGGYNDLPASIAFDHVVINFQAVGSGSTTIAHITEGSPATTLSFAGFDVTGSTAPVLVNIGVFVPTDCAGVPNGSAFIDECGNCVGGTTGLEACEQDCNGDFGGDAFIDLCGNCVGGNTGLDECMVDCFGDLGGSAFVDFCGQCVGGNTGMEPCIPCILEGGVVTSASPRQDLCIGDGAPDMVELTVSGNTGVGRFGLARQSDLEIISTNTTGTFNMENFPPDAYFAGYVSVNSLSDLAEVNNVDDLSGCYDLSNILTITTVALNGGIITALNGTTACGDDNLPSNLAFVVSGDSGPTFRWAVLTQDAQTVLASNTTGTFNFDIFGPGTYLVVHIRYFNVNLSNIVPPLLPPCVAESNTLSVAITSCSTSLQLDVNPNPSPGITFASFTAVEDAWHTLEVYDLTGRLVGTVMNQAAMQGQEYRFEYDGSHLPNGVYIYRLTTNAEVVIEKFMIAR